MRIGIVFLALSIVALGCGRLDKASEASTTTPVATDVPTPDAGSDTPVDEDLPVTNPVENDTPPFNADPDREFDRPWDLPQTQIVIDAYQGNSIDWDAMATDQRVVGVIHRSSIGLRVDTKYFLREEIATRRGYLWGAYHLGRSGDPIEQAKLFLQTVGQKPNTLMILDLEDTNSSSMMNIPNAIRFMKYIFAQTGKIPVVYANHNVTQLLTAQVANEAVFQDSRLWYARFRSNIPNFPNGLWPTYFLWQFSSEINCSKMGTCLYNVPGTLYDMDINVFFGSKSELSKEWIK